MDACAGASARQPTLVAYVYPGWHPSDYRPHVDEWRLLDRFRSYFPGHTPPARPLDGAYDDANPATVQRQVRTAANYGITAFSWFLYYDVHGFILSEPVDVAFDLDEGLPDDFRFCLTWCLRLPHAEFPITVRDREQERAAIRREPDEPAQAHQSDAKVRSADDDSPMILSTTLADIIRLLDPEDLVHLPIVPGGHNHAIR